MSMSAIYKFLKPNTNTPTKKSLSKAKSNQSIITQVQKPSTTTNAHTASSAPKSLFGAATKYIPTVVSQCLNRKREGPQRASYTGPYLLEQQSDEHFGRKTLVLDLDETLVHSSFDYVKNPDLSLSLKIKGNTYNFNVMIRPGVEEFLEKACEMFEVVIYTASLMEYAQALMKRLHTADLKYTILAREQCTFHSGVYVKDLARLGRDLKDVILVDNSDKAFLFDPESAYHIKDFFDDKEDKELYTLLSYFEHYTDLADVRPVRDHRAIFERRVAAAKQSVSVPSSLCSTRQNSDFAECEVGTLEISETESNTNVGEFEAREIEERMYQTIDVRSC